MENLNTIALGGLPYTFGELSYALNYSNISMKGVEKVGYKTITIDKNTLNNYEKRELVIICPGFNRIHVRAELLNRNDLHLLFVYFLDVEKEKEVKKEFALNWEDTFFESFTVKDGVLRIKLHDVPRISLFAEGE